MSDLSPRPVRRLTGATPFHRSSVAIDATVADFWGWACSDLLGNVLRGIVAEFLVARALRIDQSVRQEWTAYDLRTSDGVRVEVKAAGYLQSWTQKEPSKIRFDIAPKRGWDPIRNEMADEQTRQSDVYVFALLTTREPANVDPLDLDQWSFFVLPTPVLDQRVPDQKSIGLDPLRGLGAEEVDYARLAEAVQAASPNTP